MPKTKILHIITRLDRGGSAENTLLTVIGLAEAGYEVTLVSGPSTKPVRRLMDKANNVGVGLIVIEDLVRQINPAKDLKALFAIYRLIKKGNYGIVHTHSSKAGIVGRFAAYLARTPHLVHTPHGHIFYGYYNKATTKFFIFLERIAARFSDKIIALTPYEVEEYLEFQIAGLKKFTVIHSGVELTDYQDIKPLNAEIRAALNIPKNSPVIGSVGRLEEVKGYKYFIMAASLIIKQVPDAYFLLVGDGRLRAELSRQCADLGLSSRFIFTGWRDDTPQLMSAMDIFVLSSLNEGMGKVLVEAMLLEKPIIATRVGGVPGLIKDARNGMLIPPKDPSVLAAAVIELLNDRSKARDLGHCAAKEAGQYSARNMVEKIVNLYQELHQASLD